MVVQVVPGAPGRERSLDLGQDHDLQAGARRHPVSLHDVVVLSLIAATQALWLWALAYGLYSILR
jgi:hypothetical protein